MSDFNSKINSLVCKRDIYLRINKNIKVEHECIRSQTHNRNRGFFLLGYRHIIRTFIAVWFYITSYLIYFNIYLLFIV